MVPEPGEWPREAFRVGLVEIDSHDVPQRVGELQHPQVLPRPERRPVARLPIPSASMGHHAVPESVDHGLHPGGCFGALAQQMQSRHPEVPVVHHGVVPPVLRIPLRINVRPPARHQPDQTPGDLIDLPLRQAVPEQIQPQRKGLHVSVGRIEVLLHPIAVLPSGRGQQPRPGLLEPAFVPGHPPGERVVLDQGRRLHRHIERDVELVEGVGALEAFGDPAPRPYRGVGLAVGEHVSQDPSAYGILR